MDVKMCAESMASKLRGFGLKEWGILLLVGICFLIVVVPVNEKEENGKTGQEAEFREITEENGREDYVESLESRLTKLLSSVKDVGEVQVMIMVESTTEKTVLRDRTVEEDKLTEQDGAGGNRVSESSRSEEETIFSGDGSANEPYVIQEIYPKITGVVVIAQGSGKGSVDYDILNAVQVLFDVPAHKIKIMKMK